MDTSPPTFDYDRMHLLADREEIEREFHIGEKICVIFTYHSGPLKSEYKNLKHAPAGLFRKRPPMQTPGFLFCPQVQPRI